MIVLFGACKKEDVNSTGIPVQTTVQAIIPLAGASNLAVLAGASITNAGATNITGDMGLSPGTSMGGLPRNFKWNDTHQRCNCQSSKVRFSSSL